MKPVRLISIRWAFTLTELLVTIAVIAILTAMLLIAISRSGEKAKRAKCQQILRQVYLRISMYADEHHGKIPSSDIFFKQNRPQCPSSSAHFEEDYPVIVKGGYHWSVFYWWSDTPFDQIRPDANFVAEDAPWHDSHRFQDPSGNWSGYHNCLAPNGSIVYRFSGDLRNKK